MSDQPLPVLIAEWPRNGKDLIRVRLNAFNGRTTIELREWYPSDGAFKPGRAGITLSVEHVRTLADAFAKALQEAESRNLLSPAR